MTTYKEIKHEIVIQRKVSVGCQAENCEVLRNRDKIILDYLAGTKIGEISR